MDKKGPTDEGPQKADGENQSTEVEWPNVPRIARSDEFQQCFAVAQLAVKLCELEMAKRQTAPHKENLDPAKFVGHAWKLIEDAREQLLRPQSNAEYLAEHGGSHDAAENVLERILSAPVPFKKLCNKKETYTTIEFHNAETRKTSQVEWKVYKSEAGFDKLFWAYWHDCGEYWKDAKRSQKDRREFVAWEPGRKEWRYEPMAKLAEDQIAWKKRGQAVLDWWKGGGVPPANFLALAKFRREHDKRALNLRRKPKRKLKRAAVNARAVQRKRRGH